MTTIPETETVEVEVGQVWRHPDASFEGKVIRIEPAQGLVQLQGIGRHAGPYGVRVAEDMPYVRRGHLVRYWRLVAESEAA